MSNRLYEELPADKFDRLPKFAQSHIRDLERKIWALDEANRELHAAVDASIPTNTIVEPYADSWSTGRRTLNLPDNSQIEFNLSSELRHGNAIRAGITEGRVKGVPVLDIQADSAVEIGMHSSNAFYIRFPERERRQ